MPYVTLAKQLVPQHRAERRRERHGKLKRHMLIDQALHHAHQRHITLRYCFEEPIFFQKMLVLGMANEWKVCVKNESERTGRHYGFRTADSDQFRYQVTLKSAIRNRQSAIVTGCGKSPGSDPTLFCLRRYWWRSTAGRYDRHRRRLRERPRRWLCLADDPRN